MENIKTAVLEPVKERIRRSKADKENQVYEVGKVTFPTLPSRTEQQKGKKMCSAFFSKQPRKQLTVFANKVDRGKRLLGSSLKKQSILPFIETSS